MIRYKWEIKVWLAVLALEIYVVFDWVTH